jgi:hypothetical protein
MTMPKAICRMAAAALGVVLALAGSVSAQSSATCTVGVNAYFGSNTLNKTGIPYSAIVKSTFEQTLPDGNSIRGVTRARQARDSSGRTLHEMVTGCVRGEDGQPHERLQVNVDDPVNKTHMFWQVDDMAPKIVRLSSNNPPPRTPLAPQELEARRKASQMQQPPRSEFHQEDLGTRTINGLMAKGSRTVRIIPAGEEGNQQPLEVVDEVWGSRDMALDLVRIHDDPRLGKSTMEYEELNLGEPDPAMFAPPAGYKVEEVHPNVSGVGLQ